MGYERSRFQGDVDEELICSICSGVLEEPLRVKKNQKIVPAIKNSHKIEQVSLTQVYIFSFYQISTCEHAFCAACIHEWLLRHSTCPVDREPITNDQLKQVPRLLRNLLSRLQIACDNAIYGCQAVVALEQLSNHLQECQHSADPVPVFNNQ